MTATAAMRTQVRAWVNEPTTAAYDDSELNVFIERYPLIDERGVAPYYYDTSTDPPTQVATAGWYPVYDLHAAAADIWEEKAAALALTIDRPTQGPTPGVHRETQPRDEAARQARRHRSLRSGKTVAQIPWPGRRSHGTDWIGNLGEWE
jgi:hypothetical protein